ncbi:hypothetical protein E2562_003927 [Oryza meyeriana var. granulata]|uniref:Uncharacterized protein n=1 Tax=Oryza meyeriana var. granulata TaxID=110450 RepID=A0A6G1CYX9_9ORYZ|nr:hypothetical protein E2562_003927 [Oryza meyeriana var. granulata]
MEGGDIGGWDDTLVVDRDEVGDVGSIGASTTAFASFFTNVVGSMLSMKLETVGLTTAILPTLRMKL